MPNVTVNVYLTDEEFLKYMNHKKKCSEHAKQAFKEALNDE